MLSTYRTKNPIQDLVKPTKYGEDPFSQLQLQSSILTATRQHSASSNCFFYKNTAHGAGCIDPEFAAYGVDFHRSVHQALQRAATTKSSGLIRFEFGDPLDKRVRHLAASNFLEIVRNCLSGPNSDNNTMDISGSSNGPAIYVCLSSLSHSNLLQECWDFTRVFNAVSEITKIIAGAEVGTARSDKESTSVSLIATIPPFTTQCAEISAGTYHAELDISACGKLKIRRGNQLLMLSSDKSWQLYLSDDHSLNSDCKINPNSTNTLPAGHLYRVDHHHTAILNGFIPMLRKWAAIV